MRKDEEVIYQTEQHLSEVSNTVSKFLVMLRSIGHWERWLKCEIYEVFNLNEGVQYSELFLAPCRSIGHWGGG